VDRANQNTPYAGGSSGGGGSANPSVSTLTLAPGGQINLPTNDAAVGILNLEYNSTINQGSFIAFQVAPGPAGFMGMSYSSATSTIYTNYVSEVGSGSGPGGHSMAFANISSLSVSSINGAQPGGGGGGPNPVVSTLTFAAGTNGSGNASGTINMQAYLNIIDPLISTPTNFHYQFATNQDPANSPGYVSQYQSTLNNFNMWGPSDSVTNTGNFSFSCDILGRSQIFAANATGGLSTLSILADSVLIPTGATISSLSVSSINGASPLPPKMNWGAVTIAAGGSTIASVADNPYSGEYYPQATYRGNVQASLSSLFVSTIDGESFFVYGEPNQQVSWMTIGDN
jgi:hypothetical protein